MSEPATLYLCPGCHRPVSDDEPYVVTEEYKLEPGFALHLNRDDLDVSTRRRFHVEHFRGRIGDYFYELVDEQDPR